MYISYLFDCILSDKDAGRLDKGPWHTKIQHPKTAIVRPQPQVVVTQRSPSPMPRSFRTTVEERKSRLPLSTSQNNKYCKYYYFRSLPFGHLASCWFIS